MMFIVESAFNKIELLKAIKALRKIRPEIVFQLKLCHFLPDDKHLKTAGIST